MFWFEHRKKKNLIGYPIYSELIYRWPNKALRNGELVLIPDLVS